MVPKRMNFLKSSKWGGRGHVKRPLDFFSKTHQFLYRPPPYSLNVGLGLRQLYATILRPWHWTNIIGSSNPILKLAAKVLLLGSPGVQLADASTLWRRFSLWLNFWCGFLQHHSTINSSSAVSMHNLQWEINTYPLFQRLHPRAMNAKE